ncbi:PEP-CTERM sorting domain-containing protein [Nitrospira sp. Nam74]
MTYSRPVLFIMAAMVMASTVLPAHAVTFTLGNNPQADEQNVLYSSSQTGTSITGLTNQTNTTVLFTSPETLQTTALGQSSLTATDGAINNVTITVPGRTYGDLILNPLVGAPGQQSVPATVSVLASSGTATFNYNLTQGNNFLTILAASGETISSTTITSSNGFTDLRQVRISGLSGTVPPGPGPAVPEPASVLLVATGLGSLLMLRRHLSR